MAGEGVEKLSFTLVMGKEGRIGAGIVKG